MSDHKFLYNIPLEFPPTTELSDECDTLVKKLSNEKSYLNSLIKDNNNIVGWTVITHKNEIMIKLLLEKDNTHNIPREILGYQVVLDVTGKIFMNGRLII